MRQLKKNDWYHSRIFLTILLITLQIFSLQKVFAKRFCDKPFELSTQGNQIIDQCGNKFKLKGVNWFGAHDVNEVPGGLDKQPVEKIAKLIKAGGFNSVRLTFSNHMLYTDKAVDEKYIAANPSFRDLKPIDIFDRVVKALTDEGLVVILNNHTTTSQWCCGFDFNGLWHHPDYQSTATWINDWVMLAERYRNNPLVVGYDLRNEVRTEKFHGTIIPVFPNWGNGDENDWKLAATHAGNAIHNVNPQALIIVEGINWYGVPYINGYRPMLIPIKNNPLILNHPNKLVYQEHVYGFTGPKHTGEDNTSRGQKRYRDMDASLLESTLDEEFGYVMEVQQYYTAPVWLGEFGASTDDTSVEKQWFANMTNYLLKKDMGWAIWALNPSRSDGAYESYGLLNDDWSEYRHDWRTDYIKTLLASE